MTTGKAARLALAVVAAAGLAGCGAVHADQTAPRHVVRLVSSGMSHRSGKPFLSKWALRFISKMPAGDTGYPALQLVLAPAPARAVATPAQVDRIVRSFYSSPVAQAVLGAQLKSPAVSYWIITNYNPRSLFRGLAVGAKYPAVVLTYHNVPCEAYGPPSDTGPREFKCTTVAFYDTQNSQWFGIDQYNDPYEAIKKA